eukprot:5176593-Pleurochrysis_carterae.AAC.1
MVGSTCGGEVCGLLTSQVSCVVLGPWRRELPCSQAAWYDRVASEGAEPREHRGRRVERVAAAGGVRRRRAP